MGGARCGPEGRLYIAEALQKDMGGGRSCMKASILAPFVCIGAVVSALAQTERGDPWLRHAIDATASGADGVRLADVNGDGLLDVTSGWEQTGVTRAYLHPGYASVTLSWPAVTVGATPYVEDAAFGDLDGDGGIDIVSCMQGTTKRVDVHWAPASAAQYLNPASWQKASVFSSQARMGWMFSVPLQIDLLNGIDLVAGGKDPGGEIGWFRAPATPRVMAGWTWFPVSAADWVMSLIARDMDGDGDEDIVASDRFGALRGCRWLENPGSGQTGAWANHDIGAVGREAMFMTLADLDRDGFEDAVAAVRDSATYAIVFMRRLDATGLHWQEYPIAHPSNIGMPKAVAVGDIDWDGRLDIVLSCAEATNPKSGVVWLSYPATPYDAVWDDYEISGPLGEKFDRIELLDIDGDADLDVLTTEENEGDVGLGVIWYENPFPIPQGIFLALF